MPDVPPCHRCGTHLDAFAPEGMCPRCMLRLALGPSPAAPAAADQAGTVSIAVGLATPSPSAPVRFGDYELLEEIGHGGMGLVYKARHLSLNRVVALKLLLPGPFSSPEMLSRFRREAQAAAALSHPGIVPVYEVGELNGQSFFSMEYVEGRSLAQIIAEFGVRSAEFGRMARWMKGIAEAIAHAHAHGIVHRDLKPANILLDAEDRVRVADFGLAKRLDDVSDLTLTGQVLGSPDYLAPEQASGRNAPSQPASDIYAMGAMLYELLTGRPPFRSSSVQDTLLRLRDTEPVAPRLLNGSAPRDLEVICLKCLEKDPARRYASAGELADELDRFLRDEPICARPVGPAGKAWRWCRRKPALAGAFAAIATLLLTVTAVSVISAWRIATARKGEQRQAYYSNIALANQYIEQGSIDRALETLWKCPEQYRHWEWGHLLCLCHQDAARFQAHPTNVSATFFSPDSKWVVSQDVAGLAKVWDWEAEQQVFAFGSNSNRAGWIAFHPSGGQLAAAMGTNGVWVWATTGWQTATNRQVGLAVTSEPSGPGAVRTPRPTPSDPLPAQPLTRSSTSLSPSDGERAGVRGRFGEATNGQPLFTLGAQGGEVTALAYSRDGQRLATGGADGAVTVWDSASGQQLIRRETTNQTIRRVAISPNGERLVAVAERAAWVWDLQSGRLIRTFPDDELENPSKVGLAVPSEPSDPGAAGTPRPTRASASKAAEPQETLTTASALQGIRTNRPTDRITAVFADDTGQHFATIDSEGRLTLWREDRASQHLITIRGTREVFFSSDGRWMANAGEENTARVWDLATGTERLAISERVNWVEFGRNGDRMVTHGSENWVTTWDLAQGRKLKVLRGHLTVANAVNLSRDGSLVVSAEESGIVKVWSAGPGRELALDRTWQWATAFSPDGRLIANCPAGEGVIIRSVRSGRTLLQVHPPNESFFDLAFSPDSRRLATVGTQKTVKVWDVGTGQLLLRLRGHRRQIVWGLAYSPDGRWIAAGSLDGTAKVWDAHTGQEVLTLPMDLQQGYALMGFTKAVGSVQFDANAERLLTGSSDGKARIWNLATGQLLATFTAGEYGTMACACFLPNREDVVTFAGKNLRVWDGSEGRLVFEAAGRGGHTSWDFSPDGRRMFTATTEAPLRFSASSGHGTLEVWDIERLPRRILDRTVADQLPSLALSPDGRTVACASLDRHVHRWEAFPWREEEYAEDRSQESEIRNQPALKDRVRQYARRYWRERLEVERNGAQGEPAEPRVIQVPIDRALFAKRDPRATEKQIDLTAFYTGELGELFHAPTIAETDREEDNLADLPTGLLRLVGVEFDVRGAIQVRRAEAWGGPWQVAPADDPVRVDAIPIEREAARLHLLLGTIRPELDGTIIGRLVLHYADGETRSLELVYGRDVREWWYDPADADAETTDRAKVVWTGSNPVANEYGRRLRLYINTRDNPRPGVKITTFDFGSAMSNSAPFVIAVTVE